MSDVHEPLPEDWRPPQRLEFEREWAKHTEHDELVARSKERDDEGNAKWVPREKDEGDDWTGVWLCSVRPARPAARHPDMRLDERLARGEARRSPDESGRIVQRLRPPLGPILSEVRQGLHSSPRGGIFRPASAGAEPHSRAAVNEQVQEHRDRPPG